jgi:hypothetical protein
MSALVRQLINSIHESSPGTIVQRPFRGYVNVKRVHLMWYSKSSFIIVTHARKSSLCLRLPGSVVNNMYCQYEAHIVLETY